MVQVLFATDTKVLDVQPKYVMSTINNETIDKLGESFTHKAVDITTKIMASVKASDVDEFGEKLNELVSVSKQLDPTKMGKSGFISKVFSFLGSAKETMLAQYETVEERMNTLVSEMDKTMMVQTNRISDLEQMFKDNETSFYAFEKEIKVANEYLVTLQQSVPENTSNTFSSQYISDHNDLMLRLEKKIDDLTRSQHLCKLAAPEIRMMQSSARALVSTFKNIKEVTIPAWQGVFSRYILTLEQKRSAELGTAVQDATNEAFRMQADQLRTNVNLIATSRERSVVDIETLEHMQNQLIGAVQDANKIAEDGRKARLEAKTRLSNMDNTLLQLQQIRKSEKSL